MLKLSSCSAAQVPSSGACGWNTTQSQHVPAGNFLSNFPHPHSLCQRSLSPPLSPPLHLRSMMWFFKTPDKGLVMKLFYWGLFKSDTLWRSTKNLLWWFFNFQFLCPQAPHFDICLPVSLFMTYFFYWLVQSGSGSSVRSANIFVFESPVCGTSFLVYISVAVEFMILNGTRDS